GSYSTGHGILSCYRLIVFFFQAEDGIRDLTVTGVQTCALPISDGLPARGSLRQGGAGSRRQGTARLAAVPPVRRAQASGSTTLRSEERRVGKECRFRWSADD